MRILVSLLAAAVVFNCVAQDSPMIRKAAISQETVKMLKEKKDITISAKTGEVMGSKEDAAPKTAMCKQCNFPQGSLRQYICLKVCQDPTIDDETKKAFAEGKDIIISGETGAVVGTKGHSAPSKGKLGKSGFPEGSFRDTLYKNFSQDD